MKLFYGKEWELIVLGSCAGGEHPDCVWASPANQASLVWIASKINVFLGGSMIIPFQV